MPVLRSRLIAGYEVLDNKRMTNRNPNDAALHLTVSWSAKFGVPRPV
jgi:hypothetical protein